MESAAGVADPTTVLSITTGVSALQVSSLPTSSEPTTPSSESPLALDAGLREWLTDALAANSSNPKVYTKLLVSNAAAGSIIGKGGGNINDVQAKTYARIQLSKANEYFPGTTERTLLVTGRLKQVVAALGLVFAKLLREGVAPLSPRSKAAAALHPGEGEAAPPQRLLVRLLVPQPLCGVIIGKSGQTIRNYAADTNTIIRVTSGESAQVPNSHRIVTIAGEKEGVLKAIALMVLRQSEDPKFSLYGELPTPAVPGMVLGGLGPLGMGPPAFHSGLHFMPPALPNGGMGGGMGGGVPPGAFGGGGMGSGNSSPVAGGAVEGGPGFSSMNLMLTEDQAAVLLDQGSRPVVEVEQMTGCRARLEMLDGPRGPFGRLSLAGAPEAVAYAQWLLGQRLSAAASFQLGGTTYYSYSPPNGMGVGMAPGYAPAPPAPLPFMPAPWGGAPHMGLSPMGPAALQQQQQHMMAAAAAAQSMAQAGMAGGMMPGPGVMPMPMPLRQGSGASGTSTPDAPLG